MAGVLVDLIFLLLFSREVEYIIAMGSCECAVSELSV